MLSCRKNPFALVFALAVLMPSLAVYTRIGNSNSLPDWFAFNLGPQAHARVGEGAALKRKFAKQELQTVESEITESVASSGLSLNDETARDGNCGLVFFF